MPIGIEDATAHLKAHLSWVRTVQPKHKAHREMYGDKFWTQSNTPRGVWQTTTVSVSTGEGTVDQSVDSQVGVGVAIQLNLLRPLITSFVAPLGYQGLHFSVKPDQLVTVKESAEDRQTKAAATKALLERWFSVQELVDAAERLFIMGLLYEGGVALRVGITAAKDVPEGVHVLDRTWAEALPPWECVWDRRARSRRTMRYIGHWRAVPAHSLKDIDDSEKIALPDVVADGPDRVPNPRQELDEGYVYIFELWDLTVPGGRYAIYKVKDTNGGKEIVEPVLEPIIKPGKCPELRPDGTPLIPIIPFIPEPAAERALDSYSPISAAYELGAELNRAMSVIADAFRRDAARILLYLKDKVDSKTLAAIERSPDMALVAVDSDTLDGLFKFLESEPISTTILEYINQLFAGMDRTQLTADMTRGKAGNYLSATEAGALVEYSETTVGRIRKRMDVTLADAAQAVLYALRVELEDGDSKSIPFLVDGDEVKLDVKTLGRRWDIQVIDTAATPAQKAQKLADFKIVLPDLERLAEILSNPELVDTPLWRLAKAAYTEISGLLGLGGEFAIDNIMPEEPQPATPEPVQEPAVAQPGQMPTPEEQEIIASSPEGQAIMGAAEAEGAM